MEKPLLIVIAGPTAAGKSELAAELARRIDGEVVSADSMQVYRYMDIGSAKVTREEMLGVPHHMIDVLSPFEEMDVARYAEMAREVLAGIYARGHIPVLAGGTGFYIQAVTRQIDFTESAPDEAFRARCREFAYEHGSEALHARLASLDPDAAAAIHPHNIKRVIRALEYFHESGRPISEHNAEEARRESPYHLLYFVLEDDREALYARIDRRVDFMMEEGLAEEVRYLAAMGLTREHVSMQGIGYKELLSAIEGDMSEEEAVRLIKRNSRHYAKRQMTWFRREPDTIPIRLDGEGHDTGRVLARIIDRIRRETGITAKEVGNPYEDA